MAGQDTTLEPCANVGQSVRDTEYLTSHGLKFPLDKSVLPQRTRWALRKDRYEKKEADAALKLIRKSDIVLELGAGIGFMSTLIAKVKGSRAVHCYEANAALVPYIQRVHDLNKVTNVHVTNAVLGKAEGSATFYLRENFLSSSLSPMDGDGVISETDVPVLDVNAEIARIKPTVLVCDIEGAEADLLPAMNLGGLRAVLIELHPQHIGKTGIHTVFRSLSAAGLVFFPRWSNAKVACFRRDW